MAKSFAEMRAEQSVSFERMRGAVRPTLGTARVTRLMQANPRALKTLLAKDVHEAKAKQLYREFHGRLGRLSKEHSQRRLGFLSVLHSVERFDLDRVLAAVKNMEQRLKRQVRGSNKYNPIWMLGAAEIEIVNIDHLRAVAEKSDSEKRKLQVILQMRDPEPANLYEPRTAETSYALVHFHGIIDLGPDEGWKDRGDKLRERLNKGWPGPYRIELKSFFKENDVEENLRNISNYLTKGGNEHLRYKSGFDRKLDSDLDSKMRSAGYLQPDEMPADERALDMREVRFLVASYDALMRRNKGKTTGHLLKSSQYDRGQ